MNAQLYTFLLTLKTVTANVCEYNLPPTIVRDPLAVNKEQTKKTIKS